jgi:ribosomal-protein-alanine N-acetyltransferase
MSIQLRPAQEQDFSAISTWIHSEQECLRWAGPRVSFPFDAAQLAAQLVPPLGGASYVLSDASGTCLGFGQYWQTTPDAAHLGRILVSPDHRGQSVGRLLCEQLLVLGRKACGVSKATLRVYKDNEPAIRLYRTLGFTAVPEQSSDSVVLMSRPA